MIGYGRQSITQEDIDAVTECLQSDWLTQGPKVSEFEGALAAYCGAQYAVAVNSATSALHLACLALGVSPGDSVWTVPNTFVATANCARYCGAEVRFIDIEFPSGNMDVDLLEAELKQADSENRLPKVVIPVHFAGQPCDLNHLYALKQRYGFSLIEDASHALGATYEDLRIGNSSIAEVTVFSFHPVKMITTGEGGAALTNNAELAQSMRRYASHGMERNPEKQLSPNGQPWYYEQQYLGFNYRMSDINAALGLSQLKRLDSFLAQRHEIAHRYRELLKDEPSVHCTVAYENRRSSYHLFVVRVPSENRDPLFHELRKAGIGVQLHYYPVNRQPFHDTGEYCQRADAHAMESISLPIHCEVSIETVDRIVALIKDFFSKVSN